MESLMAKDAKIEETIYGDNSKLFCLCSEGCELTIRIHEQDGKPKQWIAQLYMKQASAYVVCMDDDLGYCVKEVIDTGFKLLEELSGGRN